MASNPQDPIKSVFSHLNRVVLDLLTTSSNPHRQKIKAALESEILNLSHTVNQICETNADIPSQAQSRAEGRASQSSDTATITHDAFALDATQSASLAQYDPAPLFTEQQQCQSPVSLQWSLSDNNGQVPTASVTDHLTYWTTTSQPFSTTTKDQNSSLNISSSYLLSFGLNEPRIPAVTAGLRTNVSSPSSGMRLTSMLDQSSFSPTFSIRQGYEEVPSEISGSFDFESSHDLSLDIHATPANLFNTFTQGGPDQQASGEPRDNDTVESACQVIAQTEPNDDEKRGTVVTSISGEQVNELNKNYCRRHDRTSRPSVVQLPDHLEIQKRLTQTISTDKERVIELLTRLTYAIGSGESLIQLKTSVSFARQKEYVSNPSQYPPHDLAHTMRALDMLDTVSHHSSILRRYYLVRLLRYRLKCEADFHKERDGPGHHEKKLKNIHGGAETNIHIQKEQNNSSNQPTIAGKAIGSLRADSQALQDMMKALYPHLRPTPKNTEHDGARQYERLLAKLKNRLACARNWNQFAEEYSVGILAVIPSGSRSGISSDQVEKLPTGVVASFIEFLRKVKGPFLKTISLGLSEHIFEILCGNKNVPVYGLEDCDDPDMLKGNGDPKLLVDLCSVREIECD